MMDMIFTKIQSLISKTKGIKKGILAFDLGSYSIKIAEIQIIKDIPVLTGFVQGKTYKNVIINGIINNFHYLVTNVKNILENLGSFQKLGNISLPYNLVIFDSFKTSQLPDEEEIRSKINEEIPYKIEDIYYSYYIVPKENFYQIFYLVAKKDIIEQYRALLKELDYQINNIDADFINLHNLIEFLYGKKSKVIIDWGYSKIKVLFCDTEFPIYSRELSNLGLKNLEKNIIKELRIDPDTAESLMVNPDRGGQYSDLKKIYINYIKETLDEIDYTIKFVTDKFKISIETIFLVGGGARIPNICEIVKNILKIETEVLKIENKIKISDDIDPKYMKIINTQGAIAIAGGLRDFL